jgi:MYXO-CTERM domain-containing protein
MGGVVSQSWPLASMAMTMKGGSTVAADITMKNTGSKTWDSNTKLGTTQPRDRSSAFADGSWQGPNRAAHVSGTVPPGGTWKFAFNFHAPSTPGTYHEFFSLVEEGVAWFGDPGQGGPPDNQIEAWIEVTPGDPPPPPSDGGGTPADMGNVDNGGGAGSGGGGAYGGNGNKPGNGAKSGCSFAVAGAPGGWSLLFVLVALLARRWYQRRRGTCTPDSLQS